MLPATAGLSGREKVREPGELPRKYGALLFFVFLFGFNSFITPNFFKLNTLWNILIQASPSLLVAVGMTIVIAAGGIDISVGSVMAVASMAAAKLLNLGVGPAIAIGLLAAAALGTANGIMVAGFKMQPIIVTLGMLIVARGIAQLLNNAYLLSFDVPAFEYLGVHRFFGELPIQVVIMVAAVGGVYFLMKKMAFGYYVQAVGENALASRLAGVNCTLVTMLSYTFCSLLAGLAAMIETARMAASDANTLGLLIELDAVAAIAVGGTSLRGGNANVLGTVVGILIMQLISVSVNMNNIPYSWSLVLKSIVLMIAILLQREKEGT